MKVLTLKVLVAELLESFASIAAITPVRIQACSHVFAINVVHNLYPF